GPTRWALVPQYALTAPGLGAKTQTRPIRPIATRGSHEKHSVRMRRGGVCRGDAGRAGKSESYRSPADLPHVSRDAHSAVRARGVHEESRRGETDRSAGDGRRDRKG